MIVIIHSVESITGEHMKVFAGRSLDNFDIDDLSCRSIRQFQLAIMQNYQAHIQALRLQNLHTRADSLQEILSGNQYSATKAAPLIKHLINYISINKALTLSTDADLAVTLKFLPMRTTNQPDSKDDKLVAQLRAAITKYNYSAKNFSDLETQIKHNHSMLNISNDWYNSVDKFKQAVRRKNIKTAYYLLNSIEALTQDPSLNKDDLQYILGLQLIYYIDIKNFLFNNIDRGALIEFCIAIEKQIDCTILKLKSIPESDAQMQKSISWQGLFFTCINSSPSNNIAATSQLRHVDSAKLRFY